MAMNNLITKHPVWLVGFRPFFILSMIAGAVLPALWVLLLHGYVAIPSPVFSSIQWHAHEMYFGFGLSILCGFLLTATKNWVKVRGYHGSSLVLLSIAWVFERWGMFAGGSWTKLLFLISNFFFLSLWILMILRTLWLNRQKDFYGDNFIFGIILPLFLGAKYLILSEEYFKLGTSMTLGLFRVAFLIMLERTLSQFMKNTFQIEILRRPFLDSLIKGLGLVLIFEAFLPKSVSSWIFLGAGGLLAYRFIFWKPQWAFKRLDLGIMYLGYIFIVLQLFLEFASKALALPFVGTVTTHVFSLGVMGLIIPSMIIRICQGHTGRKISFTAIDKFVLWLMILALGFRVLLPQLWPYHYAEWIIVAASLWCLGFSLLAWRFTPWLLRPRVDGKDH